jgi:hypothetical protein
MADYKTSLLVNRQVPEFIREENPVFITFLEAYYEYLETKQGTQLNDLTKRAKEIRDLSDVDVSIEEFEESFFNMYASLVPRDVAADKALLIKNVLPLYLSKGSENSFKLLFRLLFGNEVTVTYPKSEVLRASDGKWLLERYVKVNDEAFVLYTGNGTTKEFKLPDVTNSGISVYFNGVLQTTGYFVRKEIQKIYFNVAPANGIEVKIAFTDFNFEVAKTRKLTGVTSGANAIVERVGSQVLNNKLIHEFYIDENTLDGEFAIGELIKADTFDIDDEILDIFFRGLSSVVAINVIDGGSSYVVGDPVPLNSPNATEQPKAVISKVFSGAINKVNILDGGAGFKIPKRIFAVGYANTELEFAIQSVFANGANSVASSFFIYSDVISDVDPANTILSVTDWNFPGNVAGKTNVNTVISRAFSNSAFTSIGAISNVAIITSNVVLSIVPDLFAEPADITISPLTANTTSNTVVKIDSYGSIGKLIINDGGSGYAIGDELIFTNPPNRMAFGVGATGEVVDIDGAGKIRNVLLLPPKLTGTVNVYSLSNTTIQGNNTTFLTDLAIGDLVIIQTGNTGISSWETRKVVKVDSNTSFNVNTAFSVSFVEQRRIRKYGINPVGGQNYKPDRLPLVTVSSVAGANANISAYCILGDGEVLEGRGTKRPGEIERISIIDPGAGITIIPQIDLSEFGDGTATANVELSPTYDSLPGRWTSSDGILSSDRKIQGRNFYVNYSYLTSSFVEFSKYKKIFKELLHPAGFRAYAEWETFNTLPQSEVTTNTIVAPTTIRSLSGTVNVNGSIVVVGSGTKFNVANSMGIMTVGSYIAVNSEIRMINAIISNTVFTVSNAFSITANTQELVVINTAYTAVATEVTLDEIIAENELVLTVES